MAGCGLTAPLEGFPERCEQRCKEGGLRAAEQEWCVQTSVCPASWVQRGAAGIRNTLLSSSSLPSCSVGSAQHDQPLGGLNSAPGSGNAWLGGPGKPLSSPKVGGCVPLCPVGLWIGRRPGSGGCVGVEGDGGAWELQPSVSVSPSRRWGPRKHTHTHTHTASPQVTEGPG